MGQHLDKAPRGAYDAIVYIDGSEVVAEDADGRKIASGVAGVDACVVLDAAIANGYSSICLSGNISMNSAGIVTVTSNDHKIFGSNCVLTNIGFSVNNVDGISIDNIDFTGNMVRSAIAFGNCDNVLVSRVACKNTIGPAAGWGTIRDCPGIGSVNVNHSYIDCKVEDSNDFGWMLTGDITSTVKNFNFIRCEAHRNGLVSRAHDYVVGIDVCEGFNIDGMNIIDCKSTYNWDSGIHGEGNGIFKDVMVSGCYCDHNGQKTTAIGGNGIRIGASTITNSVFTNNGAGFSATDYVGCGIRALTIPYPTIISNNICTGNSGYGVEVQNYSGSRKVQVINNVISDCLDGIVLTGPDANGFWIASMNSISDIDRYAIKLYSSPNSCIIGNAIKNAPTGIKCNWSDSLIIALNKIVGSTVNGIHMRVSVGSVITGNCISVSSGASIFDDTGVSAELKKFNTGYFTESSGSSTGTGSEQTIAHGLAAIPTGCKAWIKYLVGARYHTEAIDFDATNVYPTVPLGISYEWRIE